MRYKADGGILHMKFMLFVGQNKVEFSGANYSSYFFTPIEEVEKGRGIRTEVYYSRGVTSRGLTDGGAQERQLVEMYTDYANRVSDLWPRTAAMLRGLANTYNSEARREDLDAELTEDLWR